MNVEGVGQVAYSTGEGAVTNATVNLGAAPEAPVEGKAAICAAVAEHVWPLVAAGLVRPIVHETLPLADAGRAHALLESGDAVGKVLLTVGP